MAGIGGRRERRLSHACWALGLVFGVFALAVFLFIPEVSLLSEPDGTQRFYIDRQFDLPTGDPAVFSDYSLLPLCGAAAGGFVFLVIAGAWLRGRQANLTASGNSRSAVLLRVYGNSDITITGHVR